MRSELNIRQTDRQDSGLYKCQAENAFGRSELVIYLAVQGFCLPNETKQSTYIEYIINSN